MKVSFCQKPVWKKEEWAIFFAKLDTLRFRAGLKKRDFSARIGKWNIYRKDMNRPDPDTLDRICVVFNVSQEWLCSPESQDPPPAAESNNVLSLADRIAHTDIIQRFQNKDLAREINARLLALESIDPEKLIYVKGVLDGLIVALRPKNRANGE